MNKKWWEQYHAAVYASFLKLQAGECRAIIIDSKGVRCKTGEPWESVDVAIDKAVEELVEFLGEAKRKQQEPREN